MSGWILIVDGERHELAEDVDVEAFQVEVHNRLSTGKADWMTVAVTDVAKEMTFLLTPTTQLRLWPPVPRKATTVASPAAVRLPRRIR